MYRNYTSTLRLALRGLTRSRGTSFIAVITLGAGLAAAVALLGVVDSGLRSLPVPDGGDVVALEVRNARAEPVAPQAPVSDWVLGPGVIGAGAVRSFTASLTHPDIAARRARGASMHPAVLELLRIPAARGRLPSGDDDAATLLLGWSLFEELGADGALLGSIVEVDAVPHTVIGVMPPGFGFPENEAFWTVLPQAESGEIVVRLAPGTDRRTAGAAIAGRLDALAAAAGTADAPHRVTVERWTTSRESDGAETVIFAALATLVALLLLVCCANVATLLLVRGTERAGQLAVQSALGASRARVVFQLFLESAAIAVGGGIIGLAGGLAMLHWMQLRYASHWGYYWMAMEVRPPVLLGTLLLVMLAALLAGTAPALRASRVNVAAMLVGSGRGGTDRRQRRLGRWFVGAQVAMSSLGLIAAVYLAAEFSEIGRTTQRLPLDNVAVARLTLPDAAYADAGSRADLVARLREELRRLPGVAGVSLSSAVPGGAARTAPLHLPGAQSDSAAGRVQWVAADAGMQRLYGMRIVAGRALPDDDHTLAVLVTEGVANRYFDGRAVGERIRLAGIHDDDTWAEISGVVEDWFPDQRGAAPERVIVPLAQAWQSSFFISLATAGDAAAVLGHVRGAVRGVDERVPVEELQTLRARMDWFLRMMKLIAGFGMLGGVGSALVAAVGLYGVMSFQVRTRRRELGIRMAVGAASARIVLEIVRESVLRVAPGLAAGIAMALATVPLLTLRTGVEVPESAIVKLLLVCAIASMVLLVIGVLAALEPALRAAKLQPQQVLRSD